MALAVEWLGVPVEAMPFYSSSALIRWKAQRIRAFVIETGNFGHNRDMSYYNRYPNLIRKAISLWRHTWDFLRQLMIFPLDALRVWALMIKEGVEAVRNGKWGIILEDMLGASWLGVDSLFFSALCICIQGFISLSFIGCY